MIESLEKRQEFHNKKQIEIIKAQIDILSKHTEHPKKPGYRRHDVLDSIKELKQQLKQLEDGKTN